jgi:hypothetical protein
VQDEDGCIVDLEVQMENIQHINCLYSWFEEAKTDKIYPLGLHNSVLFLMLVGQHENKTHNVNHLNCGF